LLPREALGARLPLLAFSLALLLFAIGLFVTGHDFGAMTAMIGAFLVVGGAKRAR
jgi:hypothetical protein